MKKTLVEVANVDAHICPQTKSVYVDGSIILTPGTKDELKKRGIKLVFGPKPEECATTACPPGCTCPACMAGACGVADEEELLIAVAALLKKKHGITEPEALKAATLKIVETLRESC